MNEFELSHLNWIPKLNKNPHKHQYMSVPGSGKSSTKPLYLLLTNKIISVKDKPQMYYATTYARGGVDQMLILQNSKELLAKLKAQNLSQIK
jgi:ribosomal protein S4